MCMALLLDRRPAEPSELLRLLLHDVILQGVCKICPLIPDSSVLEGDILLDPQMEELHTLQGIIYEGRKERKGKLSSQKATFARSASDAGLAQQAQTDLSKAVELVGPDVLVGAAAQGGAFSEGVIRTLTEVLHDGPPSFSTPCMLCAKVSG